MRTLTCQEVLLHAPTVCTCKTVGVPGLRVQCVAVNFPSVLIRPVGLSPFGHDPDVLL